MGKVFDKYDFTDWQVLAADERFFIEENDHLYPGCYMLGLTEQRLSSIRLWGLNQNRVDEVYIGKSVEIGRRIFQYGEEGSHLEEIIEDHLNRGFVLCFCTYETDDEEEALDVERRFLDEFDFDWNIVHNT